ncbi:MAG: heavy-metal-associated domain-containing protein [Sphaerochaetaceae bacterium]
MKKISLQLETLSCPTCAAKIEVALKKSQGVIDPEVLFNSSRVKLSYDENLIDIEGVKKVIAKLGYGTLDVKEGL